MSEISAIGSIPLPPVATESIKKALVNVAQDAQVIANAPSVASAETIQALVDARQQVLYTKAGAAVLSTTDRMVKNLLDTKA